MNIKISAAALVLGVAFVIGGVAAPAYATVEPEESSAQRQLIEEYNREAAKQKAEAQREAAKNAIELKKQAIEKAAELKKQSNEERREARKQVCEKKEESLKKKMQNGSTIANKFFEKFGSFEKKVDAFITKKGLTVEDYDSLKSKVADARNNVETSVGTLKGLGADVNCGDADVVTQNLTNYRDSVKAARGALKDYRTALVDYLVAVKVSYNNANSDATKPEEDGSTEAEAEPENEAEVETETETETEGDS